MTNSSSFADRLEKKCWDCDYWMHELDEDFCYHPLLISSSLGALVIRSMPKCPMDILDDFLKQGGLQ